MKIEGWLFAAGAIWYTALAIIYAALTWAYAEGTEPAGTTALALTAGLAFLIGFYILFTGKRIGVRPEDRIDADISERAGEYGAFSPHSWWPLPLAFGSACAAVGLVMAWWILFLGILIIGLSTIGLVFEYYRGQYAH